MSQEEESPQTSFLYIMQQMPELPEVETIRSQLEKYLVGHKIEKIDVRVAKIFASGKEKLVGGRVKSLRRFGKVLVIDLTNGYSFLIHLKLTGQVVFSSPKLPNKESSYTHVVFHLDKNANLFFNDSRKFGWIKVEKTAEVEAEPFVKKLGPEPLKNLTLKKFQEILASTRRPVKILLLDQEKLSGVGNIYANDALWEAKINPRRPANSLGLSEQSKLLGAIEEILKIGLKYQGASDQWYITAEGKKGRYQEHFLVYGRVGESCRRCGAKIRRVVVGGRGTFICANCQK